MITAQQIVDAFQRQRITPRAHIYLIRENGSLCGCLLGAVHRNAQKGFAMAEAQSLQKQLEDHKSGFGFGLIDGFNGDPVYTQFAWTLPRYTEAYLLGQSVVALLVRKKLVTSFTAVWGKETGCLIHS